MSYVFTPMTEEEINAIGLAPEGRYKFTVVKSTRKVSQNGNSMAHLLIKIWENNGTEHVINDYLVFSQVQFNIRKVRHFCEATGLLEQYKKGNLPEELENLSGLCDVVIKTGQLIPDDKLHGKPKGTCYPDKNEIIDYILGDKNEVNAVKADDFKDDDIPF